jgi:hypothetical protein
VGVLARLILHDRSAASALDKGNELLKPTFTSRSISLSLDFPHALFSRKITRSFASTHAYAGKSKDNNSRQVIRPNPSRLRSDCSAGFQVD